MLEVLPIPTKIEQENICTRCHVRYRSGCMAYKAMLDGRLVGVCQFEAIELNGFIRTLAPARGVVLSEADRNEVFFVMVHAAVSFMERCRVHTVLFDDPFFTDRAVLISAGFSGQDDGSLSMNLARAFTKPRK